MEEACESGAAEKDDDGIICATFLTGDVVRYRERRKWAGGAAWSKAVSQEREKKNKERE